MPTYSASDKEQEVLEKYLLQFLHLDKEYPLLPGIKNTRAVAGLLGIDAQVLTAARETFSENVKQAAIELLEDEDINDWLDELPFSGGETIVGLGDSITADAQGWFNIMAQMLEVGASSADFNFVNSGISYHTSTDALKRLNRDVLVHDPDWVFVALGTFDMQRLHVAPERPLVSLADFWENINTIEKAVKECTSNPIVWITPPPIIPDMMEETPLFNYDLTESDLAQVRQILTGKTGYIVDPMGTRMGDDEPEAWNYLSDGLHPSISGHTNTVKEIMRHLTQTEDPEEGAQIETPSELD